MKTPDITPAQVTAALSALIAALVVLFKLDLSDSDMAVIVAALAGVVGLVWPIADAIIRHGRASKAAAEANLAAAQTSAWASAGGDLGDLPPAPPAPPA